MNRLLAGIALSLWTTLIPYVASADQTANEYRIPSIELPSFHVVEAPRGSRYLRPLLYSLQTVDAFRTAAALRKGSGRHEENGMLRPFSHGGAPMLMFAFALGDVTRDRILRNANRTQRDSVDALQAMANIDGIITTTKSLQQP